MKPITAFVLSILMAALEAALGRIAIADAWDYSRYLRDVAAGKAWMMQDDDPVEIV